MGVYRQACGCRCGWVGVLDKLVVGVGGWVSRQACGCRYGWVGVLDKLVVVCVVS